MLSKQRHAELEEELYEEWHPEQGTNMQDMLVHKIIGLESEIKLRADGKLTAPLLHGLSKMGWRSPDEVAKLERVAREARVYLDTWGDDEGAALESALKDAEPLLEVITKESE
jgi:hypothetical protein